MKTIRPSLAGVGALSIVIILTMLALNRPSSSVNQDFVTGDVQVVWYAGDCKINVSVVASDDSSPGAPSGMITMAALPGCSGELVARVNCLVVRGNQALINGAIIQATGIFASVPPGVMGILIENPPAHDGKPADQAYFQTSGPRDCPPHSESPGPLPRVLEGGLHVHQ